jgi:uncharacterized protein (DUF2141 family)
LNQYNAGRVVFLPWQGVNLKNLIFEITSNQLIMKYFIILITVFLAQQFQAQSNKTSTITVVVENLDSNEGAVIFGLYTEITFMKAKPKFNAKSEIVNGTARITFVDITQGTYAISCFHDKNGNGQMDFEPTGKPLEPFGVSNNKITNGKPQWSDAKFEVSGSPLYFNIKLRR